MPKVVIFLASLLVVLFGLFFPKPAFAVPIADQSLSVTSSGSAGPFCSNSFMFMMSTNVAQGGLFTAGVSGTLVSIQIPILSATTSDALTVEVYNVANSIPTGSPLGSQVVPAADLVPLASGGQLSVNFASPIDIISGQAYAYLLRFPSCSNSAQIALSTGSAPADKRLVQLQSGSWLVDNIYGFSFTTFVEPTPTPTPTPTPHVLPAAETIGALPRLANTGNKTHIDEKIVIGGASLLMAGAALVFRRLFSVKNKN